MDLETVARLEHLVDRLLERNRKLEEDRALLLEERDYFRKELDRILGKLDHLDRETF